MSKAYDIQSDRDQIVIRLNRQLVDREGLVRLLDYVELESLRARSALTEDDSRALAAEVDRGVWEQVRSKYTGG
jgi:hypothetical protein